jgi:hypothetical protein
VWPDGSRYTGQWKGGKMIRGTLQLGSGTHYNGLFVDNKPTGFSSMLVYPDGSRYIGNVVNFRRQGTGKLTMKDGRVYEGDWTDGKLNGKGKAILPDSGDRVGSTYVGHFKDSLPQGKGVIRFRNGEKYDGEWENGMFQGLGRHFVGEVVRKGLFHKGQFVNT